MPFAAGVRPVWLNRGREFGSSGFDSGAFGCEAIKGIEMTRSMGVARWMTRKSSLPEFQISMGNRTLREDHSSSRAKLEKKSFSKYYFAGARSQGLCVIPEIQTIDLRLVLLACRGELALEMNLKEETIRWGVNPKIAGAWTSGGPLATNPLGISRSFNGRSLTEYG